MFLAFERRKDARSSIQLYESHRLLKTEYSQDPSLTIPLLILSKHLCRKPGKTTYSFLGNSGWRQRRRGHGVVVVLGILFCSLGFIFCLFVLLLLSFLFSACFLNSWHYSLPPCLAVKQVFEVKRSQVLFSAESFPRS